MRYAVKCSQIWILVALIANWENMYHSVSAEILEGISQLQNEITIELSKAKGESSTR